MRRLAPLGLISALACGEKVVDDPFQQTAADPTLDPSDTSAGTVSVTDSDTDTNGGSSSGDSGPGTTTVDPTTLETTDPDSGSSEGGPPGVCGDGMLSADEVCDGELFGDDSCESQGYMGGTLVCNATCQGFSTDGCYICGNGAIEMAEQCDGPLDNDITCESEGFTEGTIACDMATCMYDTSGCSLCGNGIAEGNEVCDGDDLLGLDCAGIGFDGGMLACVADSCSYDYSGCSGGQYIQDFEGGVVPAEFSSGGNQVWIVDSVNPIAGAWSAASGTITHSQSSTFTLPVSMAIAGTIEFTHEESSEGSFDYLEFYIDNVLQEEWSGINAPQMESYPVAVGNHTLEWRYTKDGSVNTGSDRVWVDDIMLTGGVPTG